MLSKSESNVVYRWNNMSFDVPRGRDESSVLIVDTNEPPRWNLDIRVDELNEGATSLAAYVDAQKRLEGVVIDGRDERRVADRPAMIVDAHLQLEDRSVLRQQQVYVEDGRRVVVATMTARGGARKEAEAAFDRLLESWRIDEVNS